MAATNVDLIRQLIKTGLYKDPMSLMSMNFEEEDIATAFSLIELERQNAHQIPGNIIRDEEKDPVDDPSLPLSPPRSEFSSSSPMSVASSNTSNGSSPSSSPTRNQSRLEDSPIGVPIGSPATPFASPLSKELIRAQQELGGNIPVDPPNSPILRLRATVRTHARESKRELDVLQQKRYEERIAEMVGFITNQSINPKFKIYYDRFITSSSGSDILSFIQKQVSAYIKGDPGVSELSLLRDIERDLELMKQGKVYPPELAPSKPAVSENDDELKLCNRLLDLYQYITNPRINPEYKEHLEVFRQDWNENEIEIASHARELIDLYVERTMEKIPSLNPIRKILDLIEKEMNLKKLQKQRFDNLYQFMTNRDVNPQLEKTLEKFPKIGLESESDFNKRLLNLIGFFVNHNGHVPPDQFIAFLSIEREMNEINHQKEKLPANRKLTFV